jgi:iron complex outermembrane receptor protein
MLQHRLPKKPLTAAIGLCLTLAGPCASAQNAGIQEVIVTAQKREQNIQETPVAISALSAEMIEDKDIRDISALNNLVPNMRMTTTAGNQNGATIAIRGSVTYNPNLAMEPTVGIYLDGIYMGKNYGAIFDVADLERIEVLRGPQGTLYGKNTVAGAINLITKQPTGEFGGKLRVGVGSYNLRTSKLDLDLPGIGTVGEGAGRLSTKIAFSSKRRDGFVKNETLLGLPPANLSALGGSAAVAARPASSATLGNVDAISGRFSALWQPAANFDVTYSYDFSDAEQYPQHAQLTSVGPFFGNVIVPNAGQFTSTGRQSRASIDQSHADDSHVKGHALTLSWDVGDLGWLGDVTVKSLTGYRKLDAKQSLDYDGTPYPLNQAVGDYKYHAWSQELQWVGSTDRIEYVAGLYYFSEKGDVDNPQFQPVYGIDHVNIFYGMDNRTWAAFGQLEWTPPVLDDRLKLTLGGRYNQEDKSAYRNQTSYTLAAPATPIVVMPAGTDADKTFSNFSPMFIAAYSLTDDINVYAKVARGWKGGGFNTTAATVATFNTPFKNETVTEYEAGVKSQWLDNRLRVNVSVFKDEHEDQQISQFIPGSPPQSLFTNAGKSTVKGVEVELVAAPIDNLEITASYGYLDAKFNQYSDTCNNATSPNCPPGSVVGQVYDASHIYKVPSAPRDTANVGVAYTLPLPLGELVSRVDWSYVSSYVFYPQPALYKNTAIDGYDLVDARITWQKIPVAQSGELAFSIWGKNLTDKSYLTTGIDWSATYFATNYFGDPRTIGFDISLSF